MRRATQFALLVTLAIAAALRIYGITFGETNPRARPDEEIFIDRAFDLFDESNHDRQIYESGWPEGYFRFDKMMLAAQGDLFDSRYGKDINLACVYALRPLTVELPIRLASVFFDLLSCILIALLVRSMFPNRPALATALGSLAFGCNYLAARNGHFAVSDALLTLLCTLTLALCILAVRRAPIYLLFASFVAGVAFGVKFSAAALALPCLAAGIVCLVVFPNRGRTLVWGLLAIAAAFGGLLFASPGVLHETQAFIGGIGSHAYRFEDGARGHLIDPNYVIPPGWKFHLFKNLPIAFGKFGLLIAALGLPIAYFRERREGLVIAAALAGGLAISLPTTAQFVRYIAPALPALTLTLGIALTAIVDFLTEVDSGLVGGVSSLAIVAAALVPPVVTTFKFDRLLAAGDTRDIATAWVLKHGGPIASQGGWFEEIRSLGQETAKQCTAILPPELAPPTPVLPPDPSNWDRAIGDGRRGWGYITREATDHYQAIGGDARHEAKYLLVGRALLPCGKEAKEEFNPRFEPECFVLRDVISPGNLSCDSTMDLFDAFYVPYDGFDGQVLTGPRIQIYENVCKKK